MLRNEIVSTCQEYSTTLTACVWFYYVDLVPYGVPLIVELSTEIC
jgi:hypothetical protein